MKKGILFSIAGIITVIASIYLFYFYINGLNDGGNIFLFLAALVCLGLAVFSFIKATKPAPPPADLATVITAEAEAASKLQQNNNMVNDYNKTAKARERLRMLELADSVKKGG